MDLDKTEPGGGGAVHVIVGRDCPYGVPLRHGCAPFRLQHPCGVAPRVIDLIGVGGDTAIHAPHQDNPVKPVPEGHRHASVLVGHRLAAERARLIVAAYDEGPVRPDLKQTHLARGVASMAHGGGTQAVAEHGAGAPHPPRAAQR